jgi:hypothetical protein
MNIVQKWLAGLIALGALGIVVAPDSHISQALGAGQKFISGTEHTAITGQA